MESSWQNFSWGIYPERYIPGRSTFTITVCNNNDDIFTICPGGYKFTKKNNHLINIVDVKLFAKKKKKKKSENESESLIQTIRIYSQDIGMGFGKEKCAMLIMKRRKSLIMEGRNRTAKSRKN